MRKTKTWVGAAALCLLLILQLTAVKAAANPVADSLRKVLAQSAVDSAKAKVLLQLSALYTDNLNADSGLFFARQAMALALPLAAENPTLYNKTFLQLAASLRSKGDLAAALAVLDTALATTQAEKPTSFRFGILTLKGNIFVQQGDYPQALACFTQSLQIAEKLNRKNAIAAALNNMGNVYYYQKNYEKALDFYQQTLKADREANDLEAQAGSLGNLGNTYNDLKQPQKAREAFTQALALARKLHLKWDEANNLNNLGVLELDGGHYTEALGYFETALPLMAEVGDPQLLTNVWNNLGVAHFQLGNRTQARTFCLKALAEGRKIEALPAVRDAAATLAKIDSAAGNFASAYRFQQIFIQTKDSIFNEDKNRDLGRLEAQYEFHKKEMEARRKAELEKEAAQRRNNLQYLAILGLVSLLFVSLFLIGRLRLPELVLDVMAFLVFLVFFEFLLILFDPWLDAYTGGVPLPKLAFNTVLAALFTPLHNWLEGALKRRFQKAQNNQ